MKEIRSPGSARRSFVQVSAGMMTDVPPTPGGGEQLRVAAGTWNSGTEISVRRPAPISAGRWRQVIMFSALVRNASWVVGTPLGWPVVPDV